MRKRGGLWEVPCDGHIEGGVGLTSQTRSWNAQGLPDVAPFANVLEDFSWALTIFIWCFSFLEQSIWIKLLGLTHIKTGGNCPSDTKGHICKTDMLSPVTLKTYLCNKFQRPGDNFQNLCQTSLQWIGKLNTGVPHLVNRWVSLENPTAEKAGSFHVSPWGIGREMPGYPKPSLKRDLTINSGILSLGKQTRPSHLFGCGEKKSLSLRHLLFKTWWGGITLPLKTP